MTTLPLQSELPDVLLFASDCHFARQTLEAMLQKGITVAGLVLDGPLSIDEPMRLTPPARQLLQVDRKDSIVDTASREGIPVYRVGNLRSPAAIRLVFERSASVLLSVCYPRLIPGRLLRATPGYALNVHPSRLPDLRGPDPLFWTFHRGDAETAVTIHHMSRDLDAGAIAVSALHPVESGVDEPTLETSLASVAAQLFYDLRPQVNAGTLPARPQNSVSASYAPHPTGDDFRIDSTWTARRAFTFARGVEQRDVPIRITTGGVERVVRHVWSWGVQADGPGQPVELADGYLMVDWWPQ